jgi:C-terminal processing protease CtpA/Prc
MVTAGQLHLTRMVFGEGRALEMLEREKARGFELIERFYGLFSEYLESRDEYESLEGFLPVILDDLGTLRIEEYRESDVMGFYPRFEEGGVVVSDLVESSAFGRAGIETGDLLLSIGGEAIDSEETFRAAKARFWSAAREGDVVDVAVARNGSSLTFSIAVPFATRYRYVEREPGPAGSQTAP